MMDCEGVNLSAEGELTLVQMAYECEENVQCVIFDIKLLCGEERKKDCFTVLHPIFESDIIKVIHDVHMDAAAIKHQYDCELKNVLDTQLVYEFFTGEMLGSMGAFLKWMDVPPHPTKKEAQAMFEKNPAIWGKRPLLPRLLDYATYDVTCLFSATKQWISKLGSDKDGKYELTNKHLHHFVMQVF